jgi:uncharacterized protein (DUF885 family)
MRALFLILAIVLGSTLPSLACAQSGNALKTLYTQEWQWRQHEFGYQTDDGEWKSGDHFPSNTPEAWDRRAAYWQQVLEKLDAIDVASLPHEEQVNAAVFRADIEAQYNNAKWRTYEAPFNSDSFFWSYLNPPQPYRDVADWRAFIGRLKDLPRYFDENIANMERGLARGWSVPRVSVQGRERTLEPYAVAEGNPFLATFDAMPETIPADVRAALQAEGRKVVLEQVVPAYRKLLAYLREDYLPNTRTTTSASDLPDGAAFYQSQIREYVTLDMTADQIHAMGLAEVARIEAEMREVMKRAGFEGTFQEFLAFLRTDPRFYAKTPRELMATAAWIAKKIDGQLKYTLGTLPRYRFTIIPVPDDIAPNYTSARGGLDACLFNTYDLPSRPLYNIPALVLHECAPGHSLQAALALEAPERPEFRQNLYFSGYGEGWGLYSEWLGTQMGVYETPYQDFGRLTMEMWRAARLVIDTGLHSKGWTRQQANDYLASHTALSQLDIENEVDRYISWPGQALSYYIGYRTLRDLRAEAERELGARFDQKRFHDTILALGAVPLPVLEQEVRRFIAGQKAGP